MKQILHRLISYVFFLGCLHTAASSVILDATDFFTVDKEGVCSRPNDWNRPFLVAIVADPQIGWNKDEYNSESLFREAVDHLNRLQPDLVFIAGDMVQTPRKESELEIVHNILEDLEITFFVTAGNHDVKKLPTMSQMNDFVSEWDLPHYWYGVRYFNILFLMIDSNILRARDNPDAENGIVSLAEEELVWLKDTLRNATNDDSIDHIVPIAHHPLAIKNLNEGDENTNTPRKIREDVVALYQQYSTKISHVLAGHFHDSARVESDGIDYVTYPATGVILGGRPREPSGFALLTVDGAGVHEEYYGYDDLPSNRPELDNARVDLQYPKHNETVPLSNDTLCISWTSENSMANRVLLEYSLNNGDDWEVMAEASNIGIYSWRYPELLIGSEVMVRISSVFDRSLIELSFSLRDFETEIEP